MDKTIEIFVNLLDDAQKFFLRGYQRAIFFIWLSDHTKMEIHPNTFKEKLTERLLNLKDTKDMYSEVLIIHAEILWSPGNRRL